MEEEEEKERKGFSITMLKEIRDWIDTELVDSGRFANRSQAIEYCCKRIKFLDETIEIGGIEILLDLLRTFKKHPELEDKFESFLIKELYQLSKKEEF